MLLLLVLIIHSFIRLASLTIESVTIPVFPSNGAKFSFAPAGGDCVNEWLEGDRI